MTQNFDSAAAAAAATTPMIGSQFMLCPCNRVCFYCPGCGYKLGSKFRICICSRVCSYCWHCGYNLADFGDSKKRPLPPSPETDAPIDASRVLYFYSGDPNVNAWYRVDLDCLPEKLYPIAERSSREGAGLGFTIIGDDLYCNGGLNFYSNPPAISRALFKCNIGNPNPSKRMKFASGNPNPSKWKKFASCKYPLGWEPLVFSLDSKIYVMRGNRNPAHSKVEELASKIYWVRVFDTKTQQWDYDVAPIPNSDGHFVHSAPALMKTDTVVLFSLHTGTLFYYNATYNSWSSQLHPALASDGLDDLPELQGCKSIPVLRKLVTRKAPLVRDSTLYWFSTDLHLYGYDIVQGRWLVSNRIKRNLLFLGRKFMPLSLDPRELLDTPILVGLSHGRFLVLISLEDAYDDLQYIAMATLTVNKKARALSISMEKCHIVPVDRPFMLSSAMSMLKTAQ